ncbi:MAG: hypothetical protein J1E99_01090 [Muribaculaceae bacterium]|nr:hypothetical protein [Muribaculaceae bacterium]
MKPLFVLISSIVIILFQSCKFDKGSTGNDYKSVDSYTREVYKAMNDGNYSEAYMVIDLMKNIRPYDAISGYDNSYSRTAGELNEKVVNNEIASLFENPEDPLIASKVSKTLKERFPGYNKRTYSTNDDLENVKNCLRMAIDLSVECGKAKLVPKFIAQIPIRGERKEGLQSYSYGTGISDYNYLPDCGEYNKICNETLDKLIQSKNFDVAQDIINLYKEDPQVTIGDSSKNLIVKGVKVDSEHSYVEYNWNSRNAAQKKLNEAKSNK